MIFWNRCHTTTISMESENSLSFAALENRGGGRALAKLVKRFCKVKSVGRDEVVPNHN